MFTSPVEDLLKVVGGGGGGARACAGSTTGLDPGIGGTILLRLLVFPGVVGEAGKFESWLK